MNKKYYVEYFPYANHKEGNPWAVFGVGCVVFVNDKDKADLILHILSDKINATKILNSNKWPEEG